jgi:hypothetical protein
MKAVEFFSGIEFLRLAEFYAYTTLVAERAEEVQIARIQPVFTPFKNEYMAFGVAYKRSREAKDTAPLQALDKERKWYFSFISALVKDGKDPSSCLQRRIEAGHVLEHVLEPYKDMNKISMNQRTSHTIKCLQDLQDPALARYLYTLGLTKTVNDWEEMNREFIELSGQRNNEWEKWKGQLKAHRKQLIAYYTELISFINISYGRDGQQCNKDETLRQELGVLIDHLNADISEYKNILANRDAHSPESKNGDEEDDFDSEDVETQAPSPIPPSPPIDDGT